MQKDILLRRASRIRRRGAGRDLRPRARPRAFLGQCEDGSGLLRGKRRHEGEQPLAHRFVREEILLAALPAASLSDVSRTSSTALNKSTSMGLYKVPTSGTGSAAAGPAAVITRTGTWARPGCSDSQDRKAKPFMRGNQRS